MQILFWLVGMIVAFTFHVLRVLTKKETIDGGIQRIVDGEWMSEKQFLRVAIFEELKSLEPMGRYPKASLNRIPRIALTTAYIVIHFLLLSGMATNGKTALWCTVLTVVYTFFYRRFDKIAALCKVAEKHRDREIRQIVYEMTDENPPKRLTYVGIVAFVLSVVLCFSMIENERYFFTAVEGGYSVKNYRPGLFTTSTQIPETHKGEPVVAIGEGAFQGASALTQITIPETVVNIGSYAFENCTALNQVQLPSGLQELNGGAFKNCRSLTEITIPEGVTEIRGNTFEDCAKLEKVQMHEGITDIHAYAFRNCHVLEQITLPSGIEKVSEATFENCTSLRLIEIPSGVTKISAHAFYGCTSLRYVHIPDTMQTIGSSAFRQCNNLKYIELPDGVEVDERTFKDSPTEILEKTITDAEHEAISREVKNKRTDVLYYVYITDTPDQVAGTSGGEILIVDDKKYEQYLEDHCSLQMMKGSDEVVAYLQKARDLGVSDVIFWVYSEKLSEISGETNFYGYPVSINRAIEIAQEQLVEGNNG